MIIPSEPPKREGRPPAVVCSCRVTDTTPQNPPLPNANPPTLLPSPLKNPPLPPRPSKHFRPTFKILDLPLLKSYLLSLTVYVQLSIVTDGWAELVGTCRVPTLCYCLGQTSISIIRKCVCMQSQCLQPQPQNDYSSVC